MYSVLEPYYNRQSSSSKDVSGSCSSVFDWPIQSALDSDNKKYKMLTYAWLPVN